MNVAAVQSGFGAAVARHHRGGRLVVQPRMGITSDREMRRGLLATRDADATTVGTITLDSYTRLGDYREAAAALRAGVDLNGYPFVAYDAATTDAVIAGIDSAEFPVQVRHGSACPEAIVEMLMRVGLHATEGGPVSYCLPYSRTPLATATRNWAESCQLLASLRERGVEPHLETFGGCMLGQLCPPALLIAVSVLEGMFFQQHGVRSISLSYAQQTNAEQDREAVHALRRLTAERLPDADTHTVIYTYMGVYPRTPQGATEVLAEAARLAVRTGAARLIVKTAAEAHRIPTIEENVTALQAAARAAEAEHAAPLRAPIADTGIYADARQLVDAVAELSADLGTALITAFRRGYLDVPYCLHADNAGRTRSYLDHDGRLHWSRTGSMPIRGTAPHGKDSELTSSGLLAALSYIERKYDALALTDFPTSSRAGGLVAAGPTAGASR